MLQWILVCSFWFSGAIELPVFQEGQPALTLDENGKIPRGAKFFLGPVPSGYDIYLAAARQQPIDIACIALAAHRELAKEQSRVPANQLGALAVYVSDPLEAS